MVATKIERRKERLFNTFFIEWKTEGLAYGHTARSYPPSHTVGISQGTCFTKHSRPEARKNESSPKIANKLLNRLNKSISQFPSYIPTDSEISQIKLTTA